MCWWYSSWLLAHLCSFVFLIYCLYTAERRQNSKSTSHQNTNYPVHDHIHSSKHTDLFSPQQTEQQIQLVNSILSSKPLNASDIQTLQDAKSELSRIRKLVQNYHDTQELRRTTVLQKQSTKRRVRNAIQDEDFISRYVKRSIPKSEEVPNLIYEAIQPNVCESRNLSMMTLLPLYLSS